MTGQRLRMVSFTFKGAEAGWVTAQRHTNECVPRVFTLLCTHTMWPFIALSCALWLLHHLSVPGGGEDQDLKRLYLLTTCLTLSEFWNFFDLSFFIGKVGTMLVPFLTESLWRSEEIINMNASQKVWHKWQLFSQTAFSWLGYMWFLSIMWLGITICYFAFQVHYCCISSADRPYRCPSSLHHTVNY